MKRMIPAILLALILALCLGAAVADGEEILGRPFPDFTVTDVDGNVFTLSEALKDHEAAVINLWATWCPPCRLEFPFLDEAAERYGDRVAFISLSVEEADTPEEIRAFRSELGLSLPMGRDEGTALYDYIGAGTIPATVVVDRFGSAVFCHRMCFKSSREVFSVIEAVLGDNYTETAVLQGIPLPDATAVFPVGASREVHVENPSARRLVFRSEEAGYRLEAWVVNDSTAHLRLELPASDDPYGMVLYDANRNELHELPSLLDADRGSYVLDRPMPAPEEEAHFVEVGLYEFLDPEDPDVLDVYLIPDETLLEEFCEALRSYGWVLAEGEETAEAREAPQAYVLHVTDQYGAPVPGVMVNFCTDMACTMMQGDGNGTITFRGAQDVYHVQLLKAPQGYSFDRSLELYVGRDYGEWVLRIRKD